MSMWERVSGFFIESKPAVVLLVLLLVGGGLAFAPFDWDLGIPRSPVGVDAIPDIGESQQIVFLTEDPDVTDWARVEAITGDLSILEPTAAEVDVEVEAEVEQTIHVP